MLQRRKLIIALAGTAASPAFAQSQSGRTPGSTNLSSSETQYIQETITTGSLALLTSRIAQQKARSEKLKEFSQFEVAEQETIGDVLTSLQDPGLVSGKVNPPQEAEAEQHLDRTGHELLQKIRGEQAGSSFDRQYLQAQIDGHEKLLRIQENYLGSGRNVEALNIAKLARGMIKEHLQLLTDIRMEMASGTTGTATRPQ
jgi:putative membrane protein